MSKTFVKLKLPCTQMFILIAIPESVYQPSMTTDQDPPESGQPEHPRVFGQPANPLEVDQPEDPREVDQSEDLREVTNQKILVK